MFVDTQRSLGALALFTTLLCWVAVGQAAVPQVIQAEGLLKSSGGGPAADGEYSVTFELLDGVKATKALWSEGPVKISVTAGRWSHALGSTKKLDLKVLSTAKEPRLRLSIAGSGALPSTPLSAVPYALVAEKLSCTGCLTSAALGEGSVSSAKVDFSYAGSSSKGGPASDLACTGCVSVSELKFDGDVDFGANSIKAKNATFTGTVSAGSILATSFVGDGSQLTGIQLPKGTCKSGELVKGVAADGSLQCASAASALPKDGLNEISNDLLSNEFTDVAQGAEVLTIPDNTGQAANGSLTLPDWGIARGVRVRVQLTNSDLSNVSIKVFAPDDKKIGITLCEPCGKPDAKTLDLTWPKDANPKSGSLKALIGSNVKGNWTLQVTDSAFCAPQKPGNNTLCDLTKKLDGKVINWLVEVDTLSTKKVAATSALQLMPQAKAPFACTNPNMGSMYFDSTLKSIRYCDGGVWRVLVDSCGNGVIEPGEQCDDGNNSNGDGCTSTCQTVCGDKIVAGSEQCDDGNTKAGDACDTQCQINTTYGKSKAEPAESCLKLFTLFKTAGVTLKDGSYWIQAPKGQVVEVQCDMSTEGGGYTYFAVNSGLKTFRSTDNNTCKSYGLDIVYPRSKAQWTWMINKFGSSYFSVIPGVTKPNDGGNYTSCMMRNPKSYGSGCGDWRVADGGRWWVRDSNYGEPNGD
ncbi:MAG TPA: hypothetical protein DCQ06_01000, partial [Myxococcales bacterium]|nr:hypothetical protein [Myxococcales bacterium]